MDSTQEMAKVESAQFIPSLDFTEKEDKNAPVFEGEKNKIFELKKQVKDLGEYLDKMKDTIWPLLQENTNPTIAQVFKMTDADNVGFNKQEEAFYIYDDEERGGIWAGGKNEQTYINNFFTLHMCKVLKHIKDEFGLPPPMPSKSSSYAEKEAYHQYKQDLETINKLRAKVDGKGINIIKNYLPSQYHKLCLSEVLNKNPDLFPCKNGVWSFKDNKLYEYEKEHYLTFKGKINYNPKADTSDIEKAINQWFKYDPEIVEFIHYFIGYIMTGHYTRTEFLFIHGANACNGKSTLWGDIMEILLGDEFSQVISSKSLTANGGSKSKSLYDLEGKRYAHVDEPSESSQMDKEMLKIITGGKIQQDAKNFNEKKFQTTHKMVFTFNKIPDVDLNDAGLYRRCVIIEQNVKFVSEEEYEKAPQELKDSNSIQIKDFDFIEKLKANKEGLLLWALQGAKKYIDDPKKSVPEKLQILKDNAKEDSNELSNWIKRNLQHEPGKNCTLSSIKAHWRITGDNFGQSKKGFNKLFLSECQKLGFETNAGRDQKSEEKILNCIRALSESELKAQAFQGGGIINI